MTDLRFALRLLIKSPGFTFVVVFSLAPAARYGRAGRELAAAWRATRVSPIVALRGG